MQASYLTDKQVEQLLAPINPRRVQDLKGMAYVAQHDVRAHMNRIFGFARWSTQVIATDFIFEEEVTTSKGGAAWKTGYRAVVRVEIHAADGTVLATYEDAHVSGNAPQPDRAEAHALALTSAVSTAFKRACTNLGDQFGLSLYEKGQRSALVKGTLVPGQSGTVQDPEQPGSPDGAQGDEPDNSDKSDIGGPAEDVLVALIAINGTEMTPQARVLEVASLKAANGAGVFQTLVPEYGVTLGVLADRVAAGHNFDGSQT